MQIKRREAEVRQDVPFVRMSGEERRRRGESTAKSHNSVLIKRIIRPGPSRRCGQPVIQLRPRRAARTSIIIQNHTNDNRKLTQKKVSICEPRIRMKRKSFFDPVHGWAGAPNLTPLIIVKNAEKFAFARKTENVSHIGRFRCWKLARRSSSAHTLWLCSQFMDRRRVEGNSSLLFIVNDYRERFSSLALRRERGEESGGKMCQLDLPTSARRGRMGLPKTSTWSSAVVKYPRCIDSVARAANAN